MANMPGGAFRGSGFRVGAAPATGGWGRPQMTPAPLEDPMAPVKRPVMMGSDQMAPNMPPPQLGMQVQRRPFPPPLLRR